MIVVNELVKKYDDKVIIHNESFIISEKGITIITGESGVGKTTLLNCILGYDDSYTGQITIDNYTSKKQKQKFRKNHIGIVLQNSSLIEEETIEYNLKLALRIAEKNIDDRKIDYCLEKVNLKNFKKRTVESLSGGQKQRVAIARALIINPKYLFLDEPTSDLDYENSIEIFSILKFLSKKISIIIISHDEKVYTQFADEYIIVRKDDYKFEKADLRENFVFDKRAYDEIVKFRNGIIQIEDSFRENIKLYLYDNKIYIDSDAEIIQGIPEMIVKEKAIEEIKFDLDDFDFDEKPKKFKPFFNVSILLFLSLFSILVSIMLNLYSGDSFTDYKWSNEDVYVIELNTFTKQETINNIRKSQDVIILPYEVEMTFEIYQNRLEQTLNSTRKIDFSCMPLPITNEDIVYGKAPNSENEALLDLSLIEKMKKTDNSVYLYGNYGYKSFIGSKITLLGYENEIEIVGVTNTSTPTVYLNENKINELSLTNSIREHKYIPTNSNINKNDIFLSYNDYHSFDNKEIIVDEYKYNIIGYKDYLKDGTYEISRDRMIELIDTKVLSNHVLLRCYTKNLKNMDSYIFYKAQDLEYEEYQNEIKSFSIITKIMAFVIMIINIIFLYFSLKIEFIQNKNHINVAKILGYNKFYKDFIRLGLSVTVFAIPISISSIYAFNNLLKNMGIEKLSIKIDIGVILTLIGIIVISIVMVLIFLYLKYIKKEIKKLIMEIK